MVSVSRARAADRIRGCVLYVGCHIKRRVELKGSKLDSSLPDSQVRTRTHSWASPAVEPCAWQMVSVSLDCAADRILGCVL